MTPELVVMQTGIQVVDQTIAGVVQYGPRILGALVVLLIGWALGRLLYRVVRQATDRLEIDRRVMHTPLGRLLGGTERAVASSFGTIAAWFVYALAVLTAAEVLAIQTLSEWIATAVSYIPAFVAGLFIIVIGFVLADWLADVIGRTEALTETRYTDLFADGARVFLYFIALVIGLDTMGVDVDILYLFAQAAAFGLAAGVALAIGIAFGWGGKDYVAENIDGWLGRGPTPMAAGQPSDDE